MDHVRLKNLEAMRRSVRSEVDFVLTFEEMAGIFDAKHVDLENMEEDPDGVSDASTDGRNFAVAGGVAQAVVDVIKRDHPEQEIKVANAEGLKECRHFKTCNIRQSIRAICSKAWLVRADALPEPEPCRQSRNPRQRSVCMPESKHQSQANRIHQRTG